MKSTLTTLTVILTLIISGYSQDWTQIIKLDASDQIIDDNLGISVAISGDYAIAGAWKEGTLTIPPLNAGAAYIYHY